MVSEVACVSVLWLDLILGGIWSPHFFLETSLPTVPLLACSVGVTASRQPPLISLWLPAVMAAGSRGGSSSGFSSSGDGPSGWELPCLAPFAVPIQ